MATLTQTSLFSKKAFIWANIGFACVIGLIIFLRVGSSLIKTIFPQEPEPATIAFGKLPPINLSVAIKASLAISYDIETITGELPNLPTSAKVFKTSQNVRSFGDLERTKTTVTNAGFEREPFETIGPLAKFNKIGKKQTLTIDTTNGNFTLESDYQVDPQVIASRPDSTQIAIEKSQNFIKIFNFDQKEFPSDKVETITYKIENGDLVKTPAIAGSNLIKVTHKRTDIDKIPVLYEDIENPKVWTLISKDQVVSARFEPTNIQKHKFSTYPLKGTQNAFNELREGRGYLNKPLSQDLFPIREVALAYLETERLQEFVEPFYIFKSDNGYLAYVRAVDNSLAEQ